MRRQLLFSLSALAGAGLVTLVSQSVVLPGADAASSETYRQLNIFGDVFEKVRSDYVEPANDAKLIEGAINGMLTGTVNLIGTGRDKAGEAGHTKAYARAATPVTAAQV